MLKKTISVILALVMTVALMTSYAVSNGAAADYGLPSSCKDGNILQCFDWTLAQIKAELPNIAAAGFTSVQTSPLQAHNGYNQWYWLYQPNGFTIGNELGSYNDLKTLCTEADRYGIKIIVDVVANHVAGSNNGTLAGSVESSLRSYDYYHHDGAGTDADWNDRYKVTHKNIGMPDLNSEHEYIQNTVYAMIVKLKEAGVDGIRWDAAKHIGLPSEDCAFWSKMAQIDMYQYGEILGAPAGDSSAKINDPLMREYAQYINVSDDKYSTTVMTGVRDGSIVKSAGYWNRKDITSDKLVYWAESHDTYSNDGGMTKNLDQNLIDKAYAILGARADSQALYLSRPSEKEKTKIYYGKKGSTHFTSPEVAAVNHFHNAMVGKAEKYGTSYGCYVVWRDGGAVIVTQSGSDVDISVANSNSMVPVGTYTDEVTGSTFTVTSDKITGHIGSTGIAVIYDMLTVDPTDPPTEPPTDPPTVPPTQPPVPTDPPTEPPTDPPTDPPTQPPVPTDPPTEPPVPTEPIVTALYGDADDDGSVSINDVTYIQRYDADIALPTPINLVNADVEGDGMVNIIDATYIQRWLAGIIDLFPVEK